MTQKLLVMERDTKEELEDAIRKHLQDSRFRVVGFSILEGNYVNGILVPIKPWEAWIIIDDASIEGIE